MEEDAYCKGRGGCKVEEDAGWKVEEDEGWKVEEDAEGRRMQNGR